MSVESANEPQLRAALRHWAAMLSGRSTGFWLLLSLPGVGALYLIGLVSLGLAWMEPEYSHGFVIAPIAAWLILRRLGEMSDAELREGARGAWLGAAILGLGLLVGVIGAVARIPDISTYGLLLWIAGAVLLLVGPKTGLKLWGPLVYLGFMLPLPAFVYLPLSVNLQLISSQIGVSTIAMFGVPVYLDGNIIDLGVYKLQVAEACSGLRYLFPLMSFGFLFAMLYRGPVWHRVTLFLLTIPVTVLMNSLRIGVIGVLVDQFGIGHAEGFLHAFEGWVIFAGCLAVLFGAAALLWRSQRRARPVGPMLDLDIGDPAAGFARLSAVPGSRAAIGASVATLAVAAALTLAPERQPQPADRMPFALFPEQVGDWTGRDQFLDATIQTVLGADDYHYASFASAEARSPVSLFIAYYEKQVEGSGIHQPEVCIPADGWEVLSWGPTEVEVGGERAPVNRAVIQKGLDQQVVYFWFEQRGRRLASSYAAKAYTVWDSIATGRTDGALVRLVTRVAPGETQAAADARLRAFMAPLLPTLPGYVDTL